MSVIKRFGLRHIRHFTAVAETLHFRNAADALGISQPALSRSIQHLERELGVTLFERDNRNVALTAPGQVFFEGAAAALDKMNETIARVQRVTDGRHGALNIGYTDFAICGRLPGLLAGFRQACPDIALHPMHGVTAKQLSELERGALDIGFVTGPVAAPGLQTIPVQSDPFVAVVPDTHALAQRTEIRLADLADQPFVAGSSSDWQHFQTHLTKLCDAAGFRPRVVQEAFNTDGILGLVACGMGVTILTDKTQTPKRAGLSVLTLSAVSAHLTTEAVFREHTDNRCVQVFADFLAEQIG